MTVLSIGECMAELAPTATQGEYRLGFAGDTFNTAWYLRQIAPEMPVGYLSAVGDDPLSADLLAFMDAAGLDRSSVLQVAGKAVGLYLISLSPGERSFAYWRGQSAARGLADDETALAQAMDQAQLIYFSGITLAILNEAGRARLLAAIAAARAQGKTVVFDPNLRPALWSAPDAMTRTVMQAAAHSDIVLPSFEDEARWFSDGSVQATAARYADQGAGIVVVKNGAGDVYHQSPDGSGIVPVPPVPALVDTTAAGDSFNAGFLAGHLRGQGINDSIAGACAVAARVVQSPGALVTLTRPAHRAAI